MEYFLILYLKGGMSSIKLFLKLYIDCELKISAAIHGEMSDCYTSYIKLVSR